MNTSGEPNWVIQEYDPEFPWWEDEQDWDNYEGALKALKRLRKDWPMSQWRLVLRKQEILNV